MTSVLELRSVRGTGGGPEKTILVGAERHDPSRYAITVCYLRDDRDDVFGIDRRAQRMNVDYVEIRERHSFDRRIWRDLVAIVRDRRIDIVHGHDYKTNLLAWLLARRTRAIPIGTAHGWTGQSWRERHIYYPAERWLLRRFPRAIAVSGDVRDRLTAAGADPRRVVVLLNGIDPAAFRRDDAKREATRRALGYAASDTVVLAVGRLERQKRFDLLLRAFAAVRQDLPGARLAIAGDGALRGALETERDRLGLGDTCRLLGHRADIADLHSAADLFVQSSEYEGTPNAVLEAMAMETPIVATDAGGTREIALPGQHAVIVPTGDVGALVSGIEGALADPPAARRRAAAARRRVETELSFDARTRRLEEIYDRVLLDSGRTPAAAGGADLVDIPHA